MNLITEEALAERFGITPEEAAKLRRKHHWPHVRFGRMKVRYTEAQVEEIIASRTETPGATEGRTALPGQTERSARRSA